MAGWRGGGVAGWGAGLGRREMGAVTYDTSIVGSTPRAIAAVFPLLPLQESPHAHAPTAAPPGDDAGPAGAGWAGAGGGRGGDGGWGGLGGQGAGRGKAQWGRREGTLAGDGGAGDVVRLVNVAPTWNEGVKSYTLNFYSRVKVRVTEGQGARD